MQARDVRKGEKVETKREREREREIWLAGRASTTSLSFTYHNRVGDVRVSRIRFIPVDSVNTPEDGQADRRELYEQASSRESG